jgi:hypothetical protein
LAQENKSQRDVPRHPHESNTNVKIKNIILNDPKTRAQELKSHYQSHFVQDSEKKPYNEFYNYCCKLGHISIEG